MLEIIKGNWQIFVTIGGAFLGALNAYKTLLDIVHLHKQIRITNLKLLETKSENKDKAKEVIKNKKREAKRPAHEK